jgi:hypothetical protein
MLALDARRSPLAARCSPLPARRSMLAAPCSPLSAAVQDRPNRPNMIDDVPERAYTDTELDAAIGALEDPERLRAGQELVMRATPSLQRVLGAALAEGGWFDSAHAQAVREATDDADPEARERAVRTLMAEETRLGMLVGVAVGFELARELEGTPEPQHPDTDQED